jgi:TRAP-type C4-dicarboxylate transport system substrate-binding protein
VNNIGHLMQGPQINIMPEEHQEAIREVARKARMEVINNLDQESKEKLKKQEF